MRPAIPMMTLMPASTRRMTKLSTIRIYSGWSFLTIASSRGRLDGVTNKELLAAINRRFDENERRWEANEKRWEANDRRWEENAEFRRHVGVRFEAVDDKFEQLLEAIGLVDWKLERFRKETTENFRGVNQRLSLLETTR